MKWWIPLACLAVSACSNRLEWSVDGPGVSPGIDDEPSTLVHLWAISEGPCTPTPPDPIARGVVHEEQLTETLPAGTWCFWSMQVRIFERASAPDVGVAPCRLESIASEARTLPAQQGAIALDEVTLGTVAERAAWDVAVERFAECAPRRDPQRCTCPFSREAEGDELACAAPVTASLLAIGTFHSCVANRGSSSITCWGESSGFSDDSGIVGPTVLLDVAVRAGRAAPIEAVHVGEGWTCVQTISGFAHCFGRVARDLEAGGIALDPVADADGDVVLFREIGVGTELACGIGITSVDRVFRVVCWGRRVLGGAVEMWDEVPASAFDPVGGAPPSVTALAVGRRHGCVLLASASAGDVVCFGENDASQVCPLASCRGGTASTPDWFQPQRVPTGVGSSVGEVALQIVAAGERSCAIASGGELRCWGSGFPSSVDRVTGSVADLASSVSVSDDVLCVSRWTDVTRCGSWDECIAAPSFPDCSREVPRELALATAGPGFVCGVSPSGVARCVGAVEAPRPPLGQVATARTANDVCPYPFPLRR